MIEYYINELLSQGITSIPKWMPSAKEKLPEQEGAPTVLVENVGETSEVQTPLSRERSGSTSSKSSSSLQLGATAANMSAEQATPPPGNMLIIWCSHIQ